MDSPVGLASPDGCRPRNRRPGRPEPCGPRPRLRRRPRRQGLEGRTSSAHTASTSYAGITFHSISIGILPSVTHEPAARDPVADAESTRRPPRCRDKTPFIAIHIAAVKRSRWGRWGRWPSTVGGIGPPFAIIRFIALPIPGIFATIAPLAPILLTLLTLLGKQHHASVLRVEFAKPYWSPLVGRRDRRGLACRRRSSCGTDVARIHEPCRQNQDRYRTELRHVVLPTVCIACPEACAPWGPRIGGSSAARSRRGRWRLCYEGRAGDPEEGAARPWIGPS